MGQGLNTKMAQIAATVLSIPIEKVDVRDNRTDQTPNASPTSASSGTDINGVAVINACEKLRDRLIEYRKVPGRSWEEAIRSAYMNQVDISAEGNFTINQGFDWNRYLKIINDGKNFVDDENPLKFCYCSLAIIKY